MKLDSYDHHVVAIYDSLAEVIDRAAPYSERVPSGGFAGRHFKSYSEVRQALRSNWDDGLEILNEMLEEMRTKYSITPVNRTRKRSRSEFDGEFNAERIINGDLDYYDNFKRKRTKTSNQNAALTVSLSTFGSYTAREILWRSAVAVAACDMLEANGISVEVWAVHHVSNVFPRHTDKNYFGAVCLKACGEPLDINYVLNGLSPWLYRTAFFDVYSSFGHYVRDGLGIPRSTDAAFIESRLQLQQGVDVFHLSNNIVSCARAMDEVHRVLSSFTERE